MTTPVEAVLDEIRAASKIEHDKGDRFEQLMLHAFRTDRTFRRQFSQVWRWMEWPGRRGADIGIDLVARDTDGRLIAIQAVRHRQRSQRLGHRARRPHVHP